MITKPKSLLLQGLQFAQMAAFCIKGTGPQWAAAASGMSVLISILWPSSAKPQAITAAQMKTELNRLEHDLSTVIWSGFQSVYQAELDSAISQWQAMFNDMAAGKLDVDTSTPTGQVNAQAWKSFSDKALDYGTWTATNPLPNIWNWAADQATLQRGNTKPEATRLETFPFYSAAAGAFLVWAQLGLFDAYIQIQHKVAAAKKAGNANASKGKPRDPNDNPQSPYFVDQQQALDVFIAYVEGGDVAIKDAQGNDKTQTYPGVLPIIHKGRKALGPAVKKVKNSAAYAAVKPTYIATQDGHTYSYPDPETGQPVYITNATLADAQQQCVGIQRQMLAKEIVRIEDQYCLTLLSNDELQAIEDTLEQWKTAKKHLATLARRHHS